MDDKNLMENILSTEKGVDLFHAWNSRILDSKCTSNIQRRAKRSAVHAGTIIYNKMAAKAGTPPEQVEQNQGGHGKSRVQRTKRTISKKTHRAIYMALCVLFMTAQGET